MRRMRHTKAREWQGCDIAYDFSNPASLYDATSGGSLVASGAAIARAEDQSGNAAHMTQSTSAKQPLRIVAAQNGLDAARFDGSNDYLSAGDVADLLAAPLEMMWLGKRTTSGAAVGYFGKSRATNTGGRWTLLSESGNHEALHSADSNSQAVATATGSTSPVCLIANAARVSGTATLTLRKNGSASSATVTDGNTSANTTDEVMIGAYQTTSGVPSLAGSFLNGDTYECAKWSASMTSHSRQRLEQSRLRKWGITSA